MLKGSTHKSKCYLTVTIFSSREKLESVVDGSVASESATPAEDLSLVPSVWAPGDMTLSSGLHRYMHSCNPPPTPDVSRHINKDKIIF